MDVHLCNYQNKTDLDGHPSVDLNLSFLLK